MSKIKNETLFNLVSLSQPIYWENQVFFLENRVNKETNGYESSIVSIDCQTKLKKIWGNDTAKASNLQLSPNKKWLSFIGKSQEKNKEQVMLMALDGGKAFALTAEKNSVTSYQWTKNSASIYYQTSDSNNDNENDFPEPIEFDTLTYELDGVGILPVNKKHQLKKISLSTNHTEVVMEKNRSFQLDYVAQDESYLLYTDDLNAEDEWVYGNTVYRYDIKSQTSESLTQCIPSGNFSFADMKDDRYCLLVGNDFEYAFVTQEKVYSLDMQTRELICLTLEHDLQVADAIIGDFQHQTNEVSVKWLTENEYLFPVTEHGKLQLYRGDTKGNVTCLFDEKLHVTDANIISDTQLIVTYSTLVKPSELGIINLETGELTTLYNPNEKELEKINMSQPEMFWYKGADDWKVQGWYVPPVDKLEQHPAILYVHGGPQVCYGESFFHEMQVHAANGYGVIMLNPRGGEGYGQEFVKSILGDYGNKDFKDLMLGVDSVMEEHPEINAERIYVAGGSYGGFMTNWIVGHTNRFKAAITQRSISNWVSFYGTSDIGPFFVRNQLQCDIDDVEQLWKMSPLAHASRASTPLLVLHGAEDLRCPKEQGEQFYIAMKRQRIKTKMIVFPKSSHGLSRIGLPNLRMKRLEAIQEWFYENQ